MAHCHTKDVMPIRSVKRHSIGGKEGGPRYAGLFIGFEIRCRLPIFHVFGWHFSKQGYNPLQNYLVFEIVLALPT